MDPKSNSNNNSAPAEMMNWTSTVSILREKEL